MTNGWQYVVPGYLVAFGSLSLYAFWIVRRGKALAKRVPEDRRRFLD